MYHANHTAPFSTTASTAAPLASRSRDFGIGYGRSSGYARRSRYVQNEMRSLFRVV